MAAFCWEANPHSTKKGSHSPPGGLPPACCFAGRSKRRRALPTRCVPLHEAFLEHLAPVEGGVCTEGGWSRGPSPGPVGLSWLVAHRCAGSGGSPPQAAEHRFQPRGRQRHRSKCFSRPPKLPRRHSAPLRSRASARRLCGGRSREGNPFSSPGPPRAVGVSPGH